MVFDDDTIAVGVDSVVAAISNGKIKSLDAISTANITDVCREQLRMVLHQHAVYSGEMLPVPLLALFCVPAVIIILLTVFGNLLVLCFKARVGRTNTTLLVWNLGLTDFLVGVIVLPMGAVHLTYRKWIFGRFLCRVWVAADVTFCTCSVVTICVISVDRYLAVTRPLRYKSIVTKAKVIGVMLIIWTFSSAILLTTVRWEQPECYDDSICFAGNEIRYLAHSVVFAFFLPASVTLTLYWRIYRLARNRQKALDRGFLMILGQNMNFLTNTISQQTTLRVHFGKNNGMVEHQRRVLRTHERIAKTLGVVSCSFLFCWLPFFSLYLTNYKCSGCIPPIAIDIASWLGYCNSMLNPIIYSFTVKEFKKSALRLVVPVWQFVHRVLWCIPPPPDNIMQRMSRHGQRAKQKTRHRSFEMGANKSGVLTTRVCHKRRQTEPAVFGIQKKYVNNTALECVEEYEEFEHSQNCSLLGMAGAATVIEEDDDAVHDYSDTNGFTTYHETTASNSHNQRFSSRRLSDLPPLMPIIESDSRTNGSLKNGGASLSISERERSVVSKVVDDVDDDADVYDDDESCSLRVICDTKAADV